MSPYVLPPNQPPARMYRGGPQITAFRTGHSLSSSHSELTHGHSGYQHDHDSDPNQRVPEDWIASTTCCGGSTTSLLGLSHLPDGRLSLDAIASDPIYWLGHQHIAAFGTDTNLLVKLLDAGQRLPIHAHPSREWVWEHLTSPKTADPESRASEIALQHGKAELWYVIHGGPVWLGLTEAIPKAQLLDFIQNDQSQIAANLIPKMHRLDLTAGQAVFIPPGLLHAIGQGLLIAEVQEPSDWSVLCEWEGFEIDGLKHGHLGVGFETALMAVELRGRTRGEIEDLVLQQGNGGVFGEEVTGNYFRVGRSIVDGRMEVEEVGFMVLIVLEGQVVIVSDGGQDGTSRIEVVKGETLVVAHGDGRIVFEGKGSVLIARPPRS